MIPILAVLFVHPYLAATDGADGDASRVSVETALLLVVFVVLAYMGKKLADLGRSVRDLEARLALTAMGQGTAAGAPPAVFEPCAQDDIDTETAVVIAATVAAVWGPSARVVSIGESRGGVRLWALEGRRQIFASHKIR